MVMVPSAGVNSCMRVLLGVVLPSLVPFRGRNRAQPSSIPDTDASTPPRSPAVTVGRGSLEGRGVDDEAVADVGGQNALPRVIDCRGLDELGLGVDPVFGAEVEHFLSLANAADARARERAPVPEEAF